VCKKIGKGTKLNQVDLSDAKDRIIKIKTLEGMAQSTIHQYNIAFNDLINFFGKEKLIASIDLNNARDFVDWLLHEKSDKKSRFKQVAKKGVKPSSANNYLQKLRAAFNILIREGILDENVFSQIKNIKFQKKKVEVLNVEEIKRIFDAFNKSYYAQFRSYVLLHTLLDTLGRIEETVHLKKQDVDFEKRSITFQNTKSKKFRVPDFATIGLYLANHKLNSSSDEFIDVVIYEKASKDNKENIVYRRTIEINHTKFISFINKEAKLRSIVNRYIKKE